MSDVYWAIWWSPSQRLLKDFLLLVISAILDYQRWVIIKTPSPEDIMASIGARYQNHCVSDFDQPTISFFRSAWSLFFPSPRWSSTSSTPPGCDHTHLFSRSFPSHLPHWLKSALRGQRKPINFRFCLISLILCVQEHHVLLHFAWFDFVPGMLLIHASCGRKRLLLLLFHFHFCFRDGVETCTPWVENTTQQIDLAFNIFFMVYFFIRVSLEDGELNINLHCLPVHSSFWQVLVHAGGVLLRRLLHHPTFFCLHLSW